jgi:hypothetical protein
MLQKRASLYFATPQKPFLFLKFYVILFSDKKENPLALLGQYSDDEEEDEEAANQPTGEAKGSPGDASAQVIPYSYSVLSVKQVEPSWVNIET